MLNSPIIGFYSGTEPDHSGRYVHEIQQWADDQLEAVHDYVQWLFPLPEPSGFNLAAPVLNRESIQAFRARPDLQEKLRVSFLRMMNFYGLEARSASKSRSIALRILQPKRPSGSLRAITIIYASRES